MDEREIFERTITRHGEIRDQPVRHFADTLGQDGGCWTWAWDEAKRRGGRYVEGQCWSDNRRCRAHAWVEIDGPAGVEIIECTAGYEDITRYQGVVLETNDLNENLGTVDYRLGKAAGLTDRFIGTRASVLETVIVLQQMAQED